MQVACFGVGDGNFALDILAIKEVINPVPITPVPGAPGFVEGIIELRGAFFPLIDLRKRFGAAPGRDPGGSPKVIVARCDLGGDGGDGRLIGLAVDAAFEVRRIERSAVQPTPSVPFAAPPRFFSGVFKLDDRTVLLVDLDQLLTDEEKGEVLALAPGGE